MHKGENFPCQPLPLYLSLRNTGWIFMKLISPLHIKTCIAVFIKFCIIYFVWEYYEMWKFYAVVWIEVFFFFYLGSPPI